ncbi:MAG: peroxiredoxin [Alphaproteobacteria bacterium]|nr:peroxiredoxin [Alphaproteobacteria bacterium]
MRTHRTTASTDTPRSALRAPWAVVLLALWSGPVAGCATVTTTPVEGDDTSAPVTDTDTVVDTPDDTLPTEDTDAADTDGGDTDAADTDDSDAAAPTWPDPSQLHGTIPSPRDPLPADFRAFNRDGTRRGPDDLRGHPTVVWFFPAAATSGCTTEGCGYRDLYDDFTALGVHIVGVSFDSPAENQRWAERQSFPFELWSDVDRDLALYYGAARTATQGTASRVTRVLAPDGRVLLTYDSVRVGVHPQQVLDDVTAIFGTRIGP